MSRAGQAVCESSVVGREGERGGGGTERGSFQWVGCSVKSVWTADSIGGVTYDQNGCNT